MVVALLVGPLALVIVEVVWLVPSRLICFCPLLLCDRMFFTKCRFVYLSPMLSVIRIMLLAQCSCSMQFLCIRVVECSILCSIVARVRVCCSMKMSSWTSATVDPLLEGCCSL